MKKTDLSIQIREPGKNGVPVERPRRLFRSSTTGGLFVKVDGAFVPVEKIARDIPDAEEEPEELIAE